MSTCPNCGSEYADGTSCVVCGHEPESESGDTVATDEVHDEPVEVEDSDPSEPETATSWPSAATEPVDDEPVEDAEPVEEAEPVDVEPEPIPVGASSSAGAAAQADPGAPPPPVTPPGTSGQPAPPRQGVLPVTESERNWGMMAHLSALVAAGLGGLAFLGPLIVWLAKKDDSRFVRHHAVEALNFNLSLMLYALLALMVALTVVGLIVAVPAVIVAIVLWFVASIIAAVKAQRAEGYRYPLTIRLIRE